MAPKDTRKYPTAEKTSTVEGKKDYMKQYMADKRAEDRQVKDMIVSATRSIYGQTDLDQAIDDEDSKGLNEQLRLKDLEIAHIQTANDAKASFDSLTKELVALNALRAKSDSISKAALETDYQVTKFLQTMIHAKSYLEGREYIAANFMSLTNFLIEVSKVQDTQKSVCLVSTAHGLAKYLIRLIEEKLGKNEIAPGDMETIKVFLEKMRDTVRVYGPFLEQMKAKGYDIR